MSFHEELVFPPLLSGRSVKSSLDPFAKAIALAETEVQPGLIVYALDENAARMAIVLCPQMPLERAMGVTFAVSLGLSDALGALAPPEVAVHFVWPDRFKVNGALCGRMSVAASTTDATAEPDWLVVGLEIPVLPSPEVEPGQNPDQTALIEEGCADVTAPRLIESWSRHTLYWINRFLEEGFQPIHNNWTGKCDAIGADADGGVFVGLDELGGKLLRVKDKTEVQPLTSMLGSRS